MSGEAQVAQLVEQGTENPRVGGSNPSLGTILPKNFTDLPEPASAGGKWFLTQPGCERVGTLERGPARHRRAPWRARKASAIRVAKVSSPRGPVGTRGQTVTAAPWLK